MAANDRVIRLTLSVPKGLYDRMHAVTEAQSGKHNTFICDAIEDKLAVEEKVLKYRQGLVRKQA